jgi:GNAT superfamily N-acetyltransferase
MRKIQGLSHLVLNHDVMAFALRAHAEMYAGGQTDRHSLSGQESAVFASNDADGMVGVIAWECDDTDNSAWVALVYVMPAYRHTGVFKRMWREVKQQMALADCTEVRLGVMAGNIKAIAGVGAAGPAIKAYESVGMELHAYTYKQML